MNTIGIDVDSVNLVCSIRRAGKVQTQSTFPNTAAGHRRLIRWATRRGQPAQIGMEATGVYSLPLALTLHDADNIDVMVVNPRAIKHFATAILQRGKTDALDADTIREYLERMPFNIWQPPAPETLEIQHVARRIRQLNNELTRERNRHLAAKCLGKTGRIVADDTAGNMRNLQRRIDKMQAKLLELIQAVPALNRKLQLITSATGIALKTGPRTLAELATLPDDMRGPQWVAHAGLDPRPNQSGTATNKPRRITKAGNRYLRDALFFPAMVACRYDPNVKAFYQSLINRGKKPMQAITAVMRKMLLAIWGMWKNDEPWDGDKFFKIA